MHSDFLQSALESVLATIGEAVVVADEQGIIVEVNTAAITLFERPKHKMLRKPITLLMPWDMAAQHSHFMRHYYQTGERKIIGVGRELMAQKASGECFPIELNIGEGQVSGQRLFTAIIRDISEQKNYRQALENNLLQRENSFQAAGITTFEWMLDDDLIAIGDSTILGLDMIRSLTLNDFLHSLHKFDRDAVGAAIEQVKRDFCDLSCVFRVAVSRKAVRWLRVQGSCQSAHYGRGFRVLGVIEDVTEFKEVQESLHKAKCDAEEIARAKTAFLANMSHELRTPLNAILGFNQVLALEEVDTLTARQKLCVAHIKKASTYLLRLINQVLDYSTIEAEQLFITPAKVNVSDLVAACITLVSSDAQKQRATLLYRAIAEVPEVWVDEVKLQQVILNLLSNAIKYGGEQGHVDVTVTAEEGWVTLAVLDKGQGIAPHYRQKLFSLFERLQHQGQAIEGTGIGLALSKKLVEAMGGMIGYNPREPRGSEFWVKLKI